MKPNIDVFINAIAFREDDVRDATVVVLDVLRACSTIQTALENGANGVIPVSDSEDPGKYTRLLDPEKILLCGEKNGRKVEGFHLGNSPFEYTKEIVDGKTLIFKTSSGTRAITKSTVAKKTIIGSFLNISAVVEMLLERNDPRTMLVCAGWRNRLSLEDLLCAGAITYQIYGRKLPEDATDGAKLAYGLYEKYRKNVDAPIKTSSHAKRLRDMGFEKDLEYCSRIDLYSSVPVMRDGLITLKHT